MNCGPKGRGLRAALGCQPEAVDRRAGLAAREKMRPSSALGRRLCAPTWVEARGSLLGHPGARDEPGCGEEGSDSIRHEYIFFYRALLTRSK